MADSIAAAAYGESAGSSDVRQRLLRRVTMLRNERSTWEQTWRDVSDFIQPRRGRFFTGDRNKGDRRDSKIVNNRATRSNRVCASGLMAGLTNPTRPWFRLTTPDPELAEFGPVKQWTAHVEDRMRWVFQRSNIYLSLHGAYLDLSGFGTTAMHLDDDVERIIRAYVYPVGSYSMANSARQRVDTVYREFEMTVGQLVERFGLAKCSARVQSDHKEGRLDVWREVLHVIEPNLNLKSGKLGPGGKRWLSYWMERTPDMAKSDEPFLREAGYEEFPVMAPRWLVTGEDIYGVGPGHEAIGDAKALQLLEKRAMQLVDKLASPPMQVPSTLRHEEVDFNAGMHTFVDAVGPASAARPAYEPNPAGLTAVEEKIRQHERRIEQAFFADLWLMLANDESGQMTATEVNRRQEEKMLQLGPVLERLEEELLDPLIERTFGIMMRRGIVPPPPEELQGTELKVEYISILAQAQRLIGIQGVAELTKFTLGLGQIVPSALDKLDTDQVIDEYAQMLGTPVDLVRTDDAVDAIRAKKAAAQQAQQQLAMAQQAAETAKTASSANLEGDNVLSRMLPALTGGR